MLTRFRQDVRRPNHFGCVRSPELAVTLDRIAFGEAARHTLRMARELSVFLPDEAATSALGARLAAVCRAGDVIALMGDLGAGKTTLARALIGARAGGDIDVPSPTFTLVQTYDLPGLVVWHFDLYRLERAGEARELGMEEAVDGLTLIEWPERLGAQVPRARLEIQLSFDGDGRIARLTDFSDWSKRLDGDWRE